MGPGRTTPKHVMETSSAVNGWLAFGGVVAGGALTKLVDKYFAIHERKIRSEDERRKELVSEESGFRSELRTQLEDLRKELYATRESVTELQVSESQWRDKYYQNVAANLDLNARYSKLSMANDDLQIRFNALQSLFDELQSRFDDIQNQ